MLNFRGKKGDWLNGRALHSHCRGYKFESCIAHQMKIFSFYGPQILLNHPKEDSFAIDQKNQIAVVADGVSLWKNIEYKNQYPDPSGSGKIADIFCKSAIKASIKNPQSALKEIFSVANKDSAIINKGRSKYDVFSKHKALFGATACIVKINNQVLEWVKICDCGIVVWNKNGKIKFQKNDYINNSVWPKDIDKYDSNDIVFVWRNFMRNSINKKGKLTGYGLVTGEPEAEQYLEHGQIKLQSGDVAAIYTDGFNQYVNLLDFRKLTYKVDNIKDWQLEVKQLIEKKNAKLKKIFYDNSLDKEKENEKIIKKLEKILGDKFSEIVEWSKEKTIVLFKV